MTDPYVDDPSRAFRRGSSRRAYRRSADRELSAFLAGRGRLDLASPAAPRHSVLIILFNQAAFTLRCLRRLAAEPARDFETVIVDNNSSDETASLLERIDGARILRNAENTGFLRAANQAAAEAAGRNLLFLNNDALPFPGAIGRAGARLESDPAIGVVGGRIVTARGRLQEAGPVVWRDAKAVGFGMGRRPDAPRFRVARDVDYVCGAFLLTPRALFQDLGGFDERFAPAYYEEMDYCFRVRAAGRRVVYDPGVRLFHLGFGSASHFFEPLGRMQRNRRKMASVHAGALEGRPAPSAANYVRACTGRKTGPWHLIVADDRAASGKDGTRAAALAGALLDRGCFVTVVTPDDPLGAGAGSFWDPPDSDEGALPRRAWPQFDEAILLGERAGDWLLGALEAGARPGRRFRIRFDADGFPDKAARERLKREFEQRGFPCSAL